MPAAVCVQVLTSDASVLAVLAVLAAGCLYLGPVTMFHLYFVPYVMFVVHLDFVTYLNHHGTETEGEQQIPWYRGKVRGGEGGCPGGAS